MLGVNALSRYGVMHCIYEEIQSMIHNDDFYARKHLISLLATAGSDHDPSKPRILDQDMDILNSMLSTIKPVRRQEVKLATSKDTIIAVFMNLGPSFPATKAKLPVKLQPYLNCRGGLYVYDHSYQ